MKPGATINPLASKTCASCGAETFPAAPTSFIFSPSSRTSRAPSLFDAGSTARPFLIRSIGGFLGFYFERGMSVSLRSAAHEQIKYGHANRHPVGDLLEDAGLRPIGDPRGDFFQFSRNPHRRSAQREAAAEFSEQMNVRTRHAAVQDVAQYRHT